MAEAAALNVGDYMEIFFLENATELTGLRDVINIFEDKGRAETPCCCVGCLLAEDSRLRVP